MSWLLKNVDASKAERGSEESALTPETMGKESAGQGKYAAVSSSEGHSDEYRARRLRVQVKHKEKASGYDTAAKVGIATVMLGPVGLAGGLAWAANRQVSGDDEVILPSKMPRRDPPSRRAKNWIAPLLIVVTTILTVGDVLLQTFSAFVSIVQGWLLSYLVYFLTGETIKISRLAFAYGHRFTEIVLTGVVIANPDGDYETPYFLMLDRFEIHLQIWEVLMAVLPALWNRADGVCNDATITIPYIWVGELTMFFEKPAKSTEAEHSLEVEPDYRLNVWKLCKLKPVPGGKQKLQSRIREIYRRAEPLNWVLGDVELRQVLVFATDLMAELLGCEYGRGLERCVYSPVEIPTLTIDRREVTLHPDLEGTEDDKEGLPTAQFAARMRELLGSKIDLSPAIKAVLASQQTFLGGKATVEQAQAHMREEFEQSQAFDVHVAESSGAAAIV